MREQYKSYEFHIIVIKAKYSYFIMDKNIKDKIEITSEDWFDTEQEARFAAIGHIGLLENGEG
jgi:hypothetical protein